MKGARPPQRPRPLKTLMDILVDQFRQLPFWSNADSRLLGHAILEHDQGRDALHAKAPGSLWIVLDIEPGNFNLSLVVGS